ncbi:MAG TPA: DUF1343 domain-containing protein [Cyclobacteriaceae bacterium]|nr:DUF1343 domain-containing protein [Cyclobacteriaceae bacterium]HMV10320.1 DUF1343 domain-containing protein [Cyclobacteriaceae bacterium]HMV89848.1 DUF1343 domain-containing protein [Cyclobacteriaceae bacterium]HMX02773.1 DUF1343 domain-containing protein [Cyclobacteriaceae bacterium]HMX50073.1 DUF1343 domain-containing protein [Cyclobacteriaceae bacterium]
MIRLLVFGFFLFHAVACRTQPAVKTGTANAAIQTGADQIGTFYKSLLNKRVALVVNHTSLIGKTYLADSLKALGVNIVKIFGPEHGFRGNAADGEHVNDSVDIKTGIALVSLYGKNKKPTPQQLENVDVVIFDIQDVGTRFYTYISTMHYVMEACAESNKRMIILDRPNPNDFVDGPMNEKPFQSFVAMHPIPIAHGLTVGELAQMINGEGWLINKLKCDIEIVKLKNWKHGQSYDLPVGPSPNLPNNQAIRLYPSICLFEGTVISVGRGTPYPFQAIGNPELKEMTFTFTPVTIKGVAVKPPHENKLCYGIDLRTETPARKINLNYLFKMYRAYPEKEKFFNSYFDVLAATPKLKQQIQQGMTEDQIRETWKPGLDSYNAMRKKYLLYP